MLCDSLRPAREEYKIENNNSKSFPLLWVTITLMLVTLMAITLITLFIRVIGAPLVATELHYA